MVFVLVISGCNVLGIFSDGDDAGPSGELSGTISEDTTLSNQGLFSNVDYTVTDDLTISAKLTIEPKVTIEFASDTRLLIGSGGQITATGEDGNEIILRGQEKTAGYWKGVQINSSDITNTFEYVNIQHTGSSPHQDFKAAIFVEGFAAGKTSLSKVSVSDAAGYGLVVENGGTLETFTGNSFSGIAEGAPILIHASQVHKLDGATTFDGETNDNNVVEIAGGSVNATSTVTWPALDAATPYRVVGDVDFDSAVKISAGAILRFASEARLLVSGGSIDATGTAGNTIIFQGDVEQAGYWSGIRIDSSDSTNVIDYAEVKHAGHSSGLGSGSDPTNILVEGFAAGYLTLKNSTISDGGGTGVYVENGATFIGSSNSYSDLAGANVVNDN